MSYKKIEAWVLFDNNADKPYLKVDSDGCFAIYESEDLAKKAKKSTSGCNHKRVSIISEDTEV